MHTSHQTELHASQMTKHVADAEAELRQMQDEKQMVLDDLRAVRDLCAKLEMSKDSLQRQLTSKTLEIEKVSQGCWIFSQGQIQGVVRSLGSWI